MGIKMLNDTLKNHFMQKMTSFLFHLHFIFQNDTIKMRKLNIEETV